MASSRRRRQQDDGWWWLATWQWRPPKPLALPCRVQHRELVELALAAVKGVIGGNDGRWLTVMMAGYFFGDRGGRKKRNEAAA